MKHFSIFSRLAFTLLAALPAVAVHAQAYPNKSVKMILPYVAGGATDAIARAMTIKLNDAMQQPFVIDNRPGAGGIGAADIAAHAPPDGYTVFLSDMQQLAVNPAMFKKLPYNPNADFVPVSQVVTLPMYIAVQSSLNIDTLAGLVAEAKRNPGTLSYGSAGIATPHHLAMEVLMSETGIKMIHVPYKGSAQSVPAFLGGQVSVLIAAYPQLEGYSKTGKFKILAVTTLKRPVQTPNIPAVSETIPNFDFSSDMGITVPAGTPPEVVRKLYQESSRAIKSMAGTPLINSIGATIVASTPEEYGESIRRNQEKYKRAIAIAGVPME